MSSIKSVAKHLLRKKTVVSAKDESSHTQLLRCLTTSDLVALGVGSTLGAGVYVLTGSVARDKTGPAIVLSYFIAALASVMAGLCYAEFGSRVPKAGSAYIYSYVTVGELWAFVIGWNLILEYVIGTASVARAWSENVDTLIGGKYKDFSLKYLRMNVTGFAEYPDFFAFAIILVLTGVLCFGVKESAGVSKLFTFINIVVIIFVVIAGSITADTKNWDLTEENIDSYLNQQCNPLNDSSSNNGNIEPQINGVNCSSEKEINKTERFGHGGFLPYGFSGMMSGAATCFFGFVGFDIIATTGEEVKNPQRSIPISIVVSLLIVFFAYVGISTVLTLMVPYYMMDVGAPLPRAFESIGWNWAVYPLAIGATCALSSSLMGGLFPMPRIVYAMAQDGLIFRSLGNISKRFKTPIIATVSSGLLAGLMVLLFDLEHLVDMMSIGTLLAYSLVALCVLILRYQPDEESIPMEEDCICESTQSSIAAMFFPKLKVATKKSADLVYLCAMVIGLLSFVLGTTLVYFSHIPHALAICISVVSLSIIVLLTGVIMRQSQSNVKLSFSVPLVPILPILSTMCNVYLMCELSIGTWVRFAVWMAIGLAIYGGYGYKNSTEGMKRRTPRNEKESLSLRADENNQTQTLI